MQLNHASAPKGSARDTSTPSCSKRGAATIAAVRDMHGQVVPGMTEEEGLELARRTLRAHGFESDWAAPDLRFGANTLKKYGEPSEPGVVLGRNDVWFVDVGPLWRNHECDYAETFVVGDDPEQAPAACATCTRSSTAPCGTGASRARPASSSTGTPPRKPAPRGWQLDLEMGGHRIGEHPHAVFHDGLLSQAEIHAFSRPLDARNPAPAP